MTISTRATLKTAMDTWLISTRLSASYDDYIQFAEVELNATLRLLQQETPTPISVSLASAASTATLPTNFLELIDLRWSDIDDGPEQKPIDVVRKAFLATSPGRPRWVAVSAVFQFDRPADQAYTLNSVHFTKWALGSQAGDTNWLLTNWPNLYLYASLAAAGTFARLPDDGQGLSWEARTQRLITKVNGVDARARRGGTLTMDPGLPGINRRPYNITQG